MAGRRWHTDGVYERWEMGARWSIAFTTHLMGRRSLQLVFNNFCCCFSVLRMRFLLLLLLLLSLLLYLFLFFFFLHKTLLICFTCHTKLELSWVFKKRSAPASPASSTSCPRVCVCVWRPPRQSIFTTKVAQVEAESSAISAQAEPGQKRAQSSVLHSVFRGCKLEKCCMKINKS